MKRRDILKSVLTGAGTLPALGSQTVAPDRARKPLLFDGHQQETVAVISDLIIPRTDTPGARDARVHEYIDLILHEGAEDRRDRFLQGLGWLDGYAIRQHSAPFLNCSAAQQTAMLKSLSSSGDPGLRTGAEFFRQIKQLTVQGYYTSKEGASELNKGGRVPGSFGCAHNGNHEGNR